MSHWMSTVSKLLRPDSFARSRSTFIEAVIGASQRTRGPATMDITKDEKL
jgi:hypothetical protein